MSKQQVWQRIDEQQDSMTEMARAIWERPEIGLDEYFASDLQATALEAAGLRVQRGIKHMPTGIIAEYGEGRPIIAILGEYDALGGLSQDRVPYKKPLVEGGPGHACGHNLLGTGGVGAVIALKDALDRGELKGTLRYYGCPAEEGTFAKNFMLRDGYFDDLDLALYWHSSGQSNPWRGSNLASIRCLFHFNGVTAHASQGYLGRSALSAVELMNTGANYLKNALPKDIVMGYSVLGNNIPPNVIPDKCTVWYNLRTSRYETLKESFDRLVDVANGAALMTGTTLEMEIQSATHELITNQVICDVYADQLLALGGPGFDDDDFAYAAEIAATLSPEQKATGARAAMVTPENRALTLHNGGVPDAGDRETVLQASGDFDLSWKLPFAFCNIATWPVGVAAHTWQATACTASGIGMKGMLYASKVVAGAAYDFMKDPALIEKAGAEFRETVADKVYVFPMAEDAVPKSF